MSLPRIGAILLLFAALTWAGLDRLGNVDALPALLPWIADDAAMVTEPMSPGPMNASTDDLSAALTAAAAEADELARLGAAKSRNLLEIERGHRRMTAALAAADNAVAADLPPDAQPAAAAYRDGAAAVRGAMNDAQQGFLTFDWDRVKRANAQMSDGAATLDAAARLAAGG
ncbi:MAG: hypothetical protein IT337_00200 [Thermomicrobiales bacterium]|nr:hypothetical protein [Thermomicrobiales bacterium]